MKLVITINTENDAFQPTERDRDNEIARILTDIAWKLEYGDGVYHLPLCDYNGNNVGEAEWE